LEEDYYGNNHENIAERAGRKKKVSVAAERILSTARSAFKSRENDRGSRRDRARLKKGSNSEKGKDAPARANEAEKQQPARCAPPGIGRKKKNARGEKL